MDRHRTFLTIFFFVDVQRPIYTAKGTLQDFQAKLREEGIEKNIVKTLGGWPTLKEDTQELKEKLKKIWKFFIYPKKTDVD